MKSWPYAAHHLISDPAYPELKDYLIRATGLAYYQDKDGDLAARVADRLGKLGLRDCSSYLSLLQGGPKGETELDALIEDLTIGETFFFRHRELFEALRDLVLPDLIARNQSSRQLRIWCAGCSTGAEPYSIAILLRVDVGQRVSGWDISIVGTDINRDFLAKARAGVYEEWAFRTTSEDLKLKCFTRSGKSWTLKPEYREGVSFQYHNLVAHPYPSLLNNLFAFDLILCRNVTIYFSADIIRRIIGHFHQCLVEGGWLLVGHSEPNMEFFRAFRTVNAPGAVLYQKTREGAAFPFWSPPEVQQVPPAAPFGTVPAWVPPVLPWQTSVVPEPGGMPPVPVAPPQAAPMTGIAPEGPADRGQSDLDAIRSLADRGELEQAAQRCQQVLARDKLNPGVHFFQALVLEQMGRHADSENSLRRAIYLDRNFTLAHYYLGLLLQKKGQVPQAVRSFQNVLQLLARVPGDHVFTSGDGITAAELQKLTQMHLEVLAAP